jgi:hypothetical protein
MDQAQQGPGHLQQQQQLRQRLAQASKAGAVAAMRTPGMLAAVAAAV